MRETTMLGYVIHPNGSATIYVKCPFCDKKHHHGIRNTENIRTDNIIKLSHCVSIPSQLYCIKPIHLS